jgi:hypothetical protein
MKGEIAPLLDHITPDVIATVLQELHNIELITLYSDQSGKKTYLQLCQFDRHQRNLRKDKEAKTQIPAPTPELVRPRSVPSTEVVPPKIKIKIKEVEDKAKDVRTNDVPVDNLSKEAFLQKYQELGERISTTFPDQRQQRQIALFVESHIKNGNFNAIIHCLEQLLKTKEPVINAKAYLEDVFSKENGNFNEAEHTERTREQAPGKKEAARVMASIGDILSKKGANA